MTTITDNSWTWTAPAQSASVLTLRRQVEGWLVGQGLTSAALEDWRLVVSELTANACQNARPGSDVLVEVARESDRIELRVHNEAGPAVGSLGPHDPGPLATQGRGLYIVDQLVDGLDIDTDGTSVDVTCWCRTD